ncbi:T6SS immunity protein Tdi1 domain-containing protein [Rummeliibacillus pycnus]|uniref:T6SS immunity protein Tdi1 domain-containing protein n=1 Tax=Rummeliibacillus pycnus TaxID=101070 RepID=UPI0037CBC867
MFENFYKFFGLNNKREPYNLSSLNDLQSNTKGFFELYRLYNGYSFGEGLYRLHEISKVDYWNECVTKAFPEFSGRISCFGYDWLGRQFALDKERMENGEAQILMFEPGTGEVLEIPCNFIEFHNEEIPNYSDACLASEFYNSWKEVNEINLSNDECVGYRVMLFLGGEDTIENLEKSNLEVYWEVCSRVLQKTRSIPEGTTIEFN